MDDVLVAVIIGSKSDWDTKRHAPDIPAEFDVPPQSPPISAHPPPPREADPPAAAQRPGIEVIIAGAGGAAHLPGMVAAHTLLPVLGVPVESHALKGLDSLLSIAQMPGGIPVGTLAIGPAGAKNAALLAVAILANHQPALPAKVRQYHAAPTENGNT